MPIHPELSLGVQPPKINTPLESLTGAVQLRDLMAQQQLRQQQILQSQAQTADLQVQAQDRQRKLTDAQTFSKLMQDNKGDWEASFKQGATLMSPDSLLGFRKGYDESVESRSKAASEDIKAEREANQEMGETLSGILQHSPEQQPVEYANALSRAHSSPNPYIQKVVANAPPQWDKTWAEHAQFMGRAADYIDGDALKRQELLTQQAAEKAHQATQLTQAAELTRTNAANTLQEQVTLAGQLGAAPDQAAYNKVLTDSKASPDTKALFVNKTPQQARVVGETADQQRTALDREQTEKDAERDRKARLAIEQQDNRRKQQVHDLTYGASATEAMKALQGVPPHLILPATADANKAGVEYAGALHAADEMKSFIDLARSGNKVAYAYAPVTGVLTINSANGTKRMNMPEIESYGGAGSYADRIKAFFGKATTGASISGSVLDDMEGLHSQLSTNAKELYGRKLGVVNHTYGSKFTPADLGGGGTSTGGAGTAEEYLKSIGHQSANTNTEAHAQPSDDVAKLVPEGRTIHNANGDVWKKINGKLELQKK